MLRATLRVLIGRRCAVLHHFSRTTMASPPDSTNPTGISQGGGLGHSTPLVTVQNVHGAGVRRASASSTSGNSTNAMSTNPAGANHPLASPPPNSSVELSERTGSVAQTPPNSSAAPISSPPPTASPSPTVVAIPPTSKSSPRKTKTATPVARSLEALADAFLQGPSLRTSAYQLPPLLRPLPLPSGEQGIQRLRTLVVRRAWGDVLQVSGDLLRNPSSQYAPLYASLTQNTASVSMVSTASTTDSDLLQQEMIEALTLECHAWLQLRRYTELAAEVGQWNFVAQNNPSCESPSWIPQSLHVLAAESLQYTDCAQRCTDVLLALRGMLQQHSNAKVWTAYLNGSISNTYIRQKEWRMALQALDEVLEILPEAVQQYVQEGYYLSAQHEQAKPQVNHDDLDVVIKTLLGAFQCEVLSRQAKILLQVGAVAEASELLREAQSAWTETSAATVSLPQELRDQVERHDAVQRAPAQLHVNDGLLAFAYSDYDQAATLFRKGMEHQRASLYDSNGTAIGLTYRDERWLGPTILGVDTTQSVLTVCCNNLALCALYTCHRKEAAHTMEALVREDPTAFLTERLAFNLCTLYELGSDTATNARRKRVLQLVAKRFFLHDIGPESFRIS